MREYALIRIKHVEVGGQGSLSPRDTINEAMRLILDTSMGGGVFGKDSSRLEESSTHEDTSEHVVRVEVRGRGWLPSGSASCVVFDEIVELG